MQERIRARLVDEALITRTIDAARLSPRRRSIYRFHEHHELIQRMVHALLEDSYVRPHKHEQPDKLEVFLILRGKLGILLFNDTGQIKESYVLEEEGIRGVEIPPRTWHCIVALSLEAVAYEIIEGPYEAATHKTFAPWAPDEDSPEAQSYLLLLKGRF